MAVAAKAARRAQRAAATRSLAHAESLSHDAETENLLAVISEMKQRTQQLRDLDERILADLGENTEGVESEALEAQLDAEASKGIEYSDKLGEMITRLQFRVDTRATGTPPRGVSEEPQRSEGLASTQTTHISSALRTHELRPEVFSGEDLLAYPGWKSEFMHIFDSHPGLDDNGKFAVLRRALTGDAKKVISGLHCGPENYRQALALLDEQFGDSSLLLGLFVTKLFDLPVSTSPSTRGHADLISSFDSYQREVRTLAEKVSTETDLVSYFLAPALLGKLPEGLRLKWFATAEGPEGKYNIANLLAFLKSDLRDRKTSALLKPSNGSHSDKERKSTNSSPAQRHRRPAAGTALLAEPRQTASKPQTPCEVCGGARCQDIRSCSTFTSWPPIRREQMIRDSGRCFSCLKRSHFTRSCSCLLYTSPSPRDS